MKDLAQLELDRLGADLKINFILGLHQIAICVLGRIMDDE